MALAVGVSVVAVCSDDDLDHQQRVEAAAVDVDDGESPAAASLQLRRRSANYQPTTWDYDSICTSLLSRRRHGGSQEDDANRHLQLQLQLVQVATSDTEDSLSSEMESVQASLKDSVRHLLLVLQQQQQQQQEEEEEEEEEDHDDDDSNNTRSSSRVVLIRAIHQLQSLGIAYHFHQEIRDILMSMHHQQQHHLDLHSAALLFRMLRGLGIPASADMLMRALGEEEEDDKVVAIDRDGLLALYQASFLAFPGETVLDQARAFAVGKLAGRDSDDMDTHLSTLPLHWRAPRLQAMWSLQEDQEDHHQQQQQQQQGIILQLAQVDFNLVQALHRRELSEVTRWWKEESGLLLGKGDSSCFARDRVVECFFCAACIAPEPRLAECREVLAKTGALIVHLDDIYDVYGTPEELQAFTDAIDTWEHCCNVDLPEYMKAMYSAILTTSTTAADRVLQKHGYDMLPLYKKAWHELCKAFLVEAQWQQQQQQQGHASMPSFAEYVSNGWVTSTGPLLLLHALPAAITPPPITNAANNGGIDYPRLVELSSTIFRLCNDCASHQAEAERGDAPSSIACCMAEPWCAGEDQARAAVQGVIAETWKALNWEVVVAASGSGSATASPAESMTTMASLCLNLARIIHCIYQDGDGITSPTDRMKQMVKDMLFNPVDHVQ